MFWDSKICSVRLNTLYIVTILVNRYFKIPQDFIFIHFSVGPI